MSMAPTPMIVCVEDQEYIELLLRYIRASEYAASVRIRAFSDVNLFVQYITTERPKGLVAAEETFLEAWRTDEHFHQQDGYDWVKRMSNMRMDIRLASINRYIIY